MANSVQTAKEALCELAMKLMNMKNLQIIFIELALIILLT